MVWNDVEQVKIKKKYRDFRMSFQDQTWLNIWVNHGESKASPHSNHPNSTCQTIHGFFRGPGDLNVTSPGLQGPASQVGLVWWPKPAGSNRCGRSLRCSSLWRAAGRPLEGDLAENLREKNVENVWTCGKTLEKPWKHVVNMWVKCRKMGETCGEKCGWDAGEIMRFDRCRDSKPKKEGAWRSLK